jgi:hypothetical protein
MKTKEYLYNFVGGGWNSVFATTKRGAIKAARARWKGDDGLVVDENSFRVSTPSDYQALMSLFY